MNKTYGDILKQTEDNNEAELPFRHKKSGGNY